eukprot:TRINITY_DN2048_c5_g1_i2.p1 TRINITY_DN2048_c5_g1~~TRINITY_DN2048_c5_g1_i2.p1  ORF type:complete len:408 (+),score=53.12 TRINITY_DN2048_c5_g1_i2:338-1561(+)
MRNNLLLRERMDYALLCRQLDRELEGLDICHCQIRATTGFNDDQGDSKYGLTHSEQDVAIKELYFLAQILKKEVGASRTLAVRKEEVILKFLNDAAAVERAHEKKHEIMNEINTMNNSLRDISFTLEDLQRQHDRLDLSLHKGELHVASMTSASHLVLDTSCLKNKVDEQRTIRKRKESQAKLQTKYLELAKTRLGVVELALTDLQIKKTIDRKLRRAVIAVPPENIVDEFEEGLPERMPAVLYELMARHKEAILNSIRLKDILLNEKQATVDATELKLANLWLENEQVMGEKDKELIRYQKKLEGISREVNQTREELQSNLHVLHQEKRLKQSQCDALIEKVTGLSRFAARRAAAMPATPRLPASPSTPSRASRHTPTPRNTPTPRQTPTPRRRRKKSMKDSPKNI